MIKKVEMYAGDSSTILKDYLIVDSHPKTVELKGGTNIRKVTVEEDDNGDYWAWWDNEDESFRYIYPKEFLTRMCDPYYFKYQEESCKGKVLKVSVSEVKNDE